MKIQTLEVSGFIGCLESLRLPYKLECRSNWQEDQSIFDDIMITDDFTHLHQASTMINIHNKDLKLLQTLIKRGDEHAKSLRLIRVDCKIKAPLFWWSEMDTYEVGVVNGCSESTMHTLKNEVLTYDSFEGGNVTDEMLKSIQNSIEFGDHIEIIKSLLPSSYLQERVISFSYQTLRRMCIQRENHKLSQWRIFIDWVKTLPMSELITGKDVSDIS